MIQIQHLTKRFAAAGATVVALNDINLEIQDGDIYGIIGMSGAPDIVDPQQLKDLSIALTLTE